MVTPTVVDVLSTNYISAAVFLKFRKCGEDLNKPNIHVHATALFMWLDIVYQISQHIDDIFTIRRLFYEAEAVLSCLKQHDGRSVQAEIPIITSMTRNRCNIHFFNNNKDEMMRNLVRILDGDGKIVLNDNLAEFFMMYREDPSCSSLLPNVPALPEKLRQLFRPAADVIDEAHVSVQRKVEARSMYVTILKESPITKDQIVEYFIERWGDCIDQVLRNRPDQIILASNIEAMVIMFKSDAYIGLALNGQDIIKYQITGSQLRARRFFGQFVDSRFLVVP